MIGQVVSKYRVIAEIGRGSMGRVYKSVDIYLGRWAALKLMEARYAEDREALRRFEREGNVMAALAHPNICTVFEAGRWQEHPFLAMELLEGMPLSERMRAGRMTVEEAAAVGVPVASALAAAHAKGIVHRDIKPGNLFLTTRGQVKVLDFGLAKMKRTSPPGSSAGGDAQPTVATFVTLPGTILGTLAYMAPEQVRGEAVDGRADLYSLGVVLYELCTGSLPIGRAVTGAGALAPVIRRMIAADVTARYRDAQEVRQALENVKAAGASA